MCWREAGREIQALVLPVQERREVLRGLYCGGEEGDTEFIGRYKLVALHDGTKTADAPLAGEYTFNPDRPEYGVRHIPASADAPPLIALYQYVACAIQNVELYRLDSGGIEHVVFVDLEGNEHDTAELRTQDEASWSSSGELSLCVYDNSDGSTPCNDYRYDEGRLKQVRHRREAPQ